MVKLNLPEFEYKLQKAEGKVWIFDVIRKKFIVLTPEEWVRQHFIQYMINHLQYPKSLIKVEGGLTFNRLQKRSDIALYDRVGAPWMVIECKAPSQPVSDETLHQVTTYNATLRAPFVVVTNGLIHFCASVDWHSRRTELMPALPKFPS